MVKMITKIKVQPIARDINDVDLSMCLKAEENEGWLEAIVSNDQTAVESMLKECDQEQKTST